MNNLPPAIRPIYTTSEPNINIPLYEGRLEISLSGEQNKSSAQGSGTLEYAWFPIPHIQFNLEGVMVTRFNGDSFSLTPLDIEVLPLKTFIKLSSLGGNNGSFVSGRVTEPIVQGKSQDLSYVLFHVVNFHNLRSTSGSKFTDDSGMYVLYRHVFEKDEWKITLDNLKTTQNNVKSLNSQGGFAITHVGKLEKSDGQTFSEKDASNLLKMFTDFLSFARGFLISVILPVGCDKQGKQSWICWEGNIANSWKNVESWCPKDHANDLVKLFPGFVDWWQSWKESERIPLYWYLQANYELLSEQAIVNVHIAFEILACVLLLEKGSLSKTKFEDLDLTAKLCKLLSEFRIPLEIPESNFLHDLRKFSDNQKWGKNYKVLIKIRNAIIHSETKRRNLIYHADSMVKFGASDLGLWYLELILLAIYKYQEHYSNRLENSNIETVPWSKKEENKQGI